MTVAELIEALKALPLEHEVFVNDYEMGLCALKAVEARAIGKFELNDSVIGSPIVVITSDARL